MKKTFYTFFSLIILLLIFNFIAGIFFWVWNRNKDSIAKIYVDAPYVYYKQNSFETGFNIQDELPLNKASNELRILILGGSVAYSMGNVLSISDSSDSKTNNPSYLEAKIKNILPLKKITVINGALPAYVTQQEFIAFQMILSKYNPDLVIGIHGFNDMESFRVNHHIDDLKYIPSPIFYGGDEFSPALTAINEHKKEYTFQGVTEGYYKYIRKGFRFLGRSLKLYKYPFEKTNDINDKKIEAYALAYKSICSDLSNFCSIKGVKYINFLQPVKFYNSKDSNYHTSNNQQLKPISPWLSKLYFKMEDLSNSLPNNHNLTGLDMKKLEMKDDCHPSETGYKYLIDEIVLKITPDLLFLNK